MKDGQCPIILEDIADAVNQTGKERKVKLNGEYPEKLGNPTNVKLGNGLIFIGSSSGNVIIYEFEEKVMHKPIVSE